MKVILGVLNSHEKLQSDPTHHLGHHHTHMILNKLVYIQYYIL